MVARTRRAATRAAGKEDALVVGGMDSRNDRTRSIHTAVCSKANGGFALLGPIAISDQPSSELDRIAAVFLRGYRITLKDIYGIMAP